MHLSTVAHNCHVINLTAKRKRLPAKRITLPCSKKKNLPAKRKKTRSKKKTSRQIRKRLAAKFLRYREDILILISFAVRLWLFFLPCGYSICREVNSFAVTFVGHRITLKFCSRSFLIFQHVGIREN